MKYSGKIIAVSWKNKSVKIGDDWFECGSIPTSDFHKGDEVEVEVEGKVINTMRVTKQGWYGSGGRDQREENIKRLAIGHAVSRVVAGMKPETIDEAEELIDKLWAKFQSKVDA